MVSKKRGKGRPIKYKDLYHKLVREHQQRYWKKNREAILLGMKLKISVKEARKRLAKQKKRAEKRGGKK